MEYLGTFPAGFTDLVKTLMLRDTAAQEVLFCDESVIAFRSAKSFSALPYLKQLYPLIAWGKAENLASAYQFILHISQDFFHERLDMQLKPRSQYDFVIRTFAEGNPAPIVHDLHVKLEQKLSLILKGRPNSERPELELQLHVRKNHQYYLILQRSKRVYGWLPPGTLPPYLCRLILEVSECQKDDIFLDPFMGSGAIPLERARMGPYHFIFAGDIDEKKVEHLKTVLKQKEWEKRRKTIFPKVLDAANLANFETGFITRLVSDPPWGLYEDLGAAALQALYINFLREAARILAKTGRMVLLVGATVPLPDLIKGAQLSLAITEHFPVLVSGQKALVYVIIPE